MVRRGIAIAALALAACVAPARVPTPAEIASADLGPKPERADLIVKDHMEFELKDAATALWERWTATAPAFYSWPGGKIVYGWGICAMVNAKNSHGAYTGFERLFFLIRDDRVIVYEGEPYSDRSCQGQGAKGAIE